MAILNCNSSGPSSFFATERCFQMGIARDIFKKIETKDGKKAIAFTEEYIASKVKESKTEANEAEKPAASDTESDKG